jgi:hypothetical protein
MDEATLINKLTETSEFKRLQTIGNQIHDSQRQFDLLTVYEELIDEMAWSRLFAYLLDSTQNHELGQSAFRKLLKIIPELITFSNSLEPEEETETICVTEWKTENLRRIDILIKLIDKKGKVKAVLGIENKVDSGEQNNQIRDYQKSMNIAFPNLPKYLIYLSPDGRLTQTSDENNYCPCISVSYDVLSMVCKEVSTKKTGQGQVFLSILQNYIDKQTNNKLMDKEALQLIKKLYSDKNYRQAIKLLSLYTPNTKTVFDEVIEKILITNNLPFEKDRVSFDYYPKTSSTPYEFKIYIHDLTDIGHNKGFHGIYMLRCENSSPDIGDYFTLRLVVGFFNKKEKDTMQKQTLRDKTLSSFSLPNSLGTNKNWGPWTCVWTGDRYKLSDLGDKDVKGLNNLLINGINETYLDFKNGLKKLSRIRL